MERAWQELEAIGINPLFSCEDPEAGKEIYADFNEKVDLAKLRIQFDWIKDILIAPLADIDWTSLWASHGLDYRDGYVHVDLRHFGGEGIVRLKPGPGFGDLSHPTTRLTLELAVPILPNQHVLDIGCGSGVLSLCAAALGAKTVYAIDIDPAALLHTQANAELNNLQVMTSLPPSNLKHLLVLMNMIRSEQVVAWESLPQIHSIPGDCITSGILVQERKLYLEQTQRWGWKLIKETESDGWLAFHFSRKR